MRTFRLVRDVDVTGISGTGLVAEGVEFNDGTVALRWEGPIQQPWGLIEPTTVIHPNIANVEHLHGHNGQTHIEWEDEKGDSMSEQAPEPTPDLDDEPDTEEGVDEDFDPDEEIDPDDSADPGEGGNKGTEEGDDE